MSEQSKMNLPLEIDGAGLPPLGMQAEDFLRDYWQQRPLLVRNAFPAFAAGTVSGDGGCPLNGDDLAALAMAEQALSRLVSNRRRGDRWSLQNGPFTEADYAELGPRDWTLLVQDVDKWDSDVAALLEHFRFLPSWRIDDVMVSFAAPGGSVGAHVDHYDVFLLQGLGHRHWAIDTRPGPDLSFRDDAPLKLLRSFKPNQDWLLGPGDMLYLPPGMPHHGVATDPCLTLSIGMRAPAIAELMTALTEQFAQNLDEGLRFRDSGRSVTTSLGQLEDTDLERLRSQVGAALQTLQQLPAAQLGDFCGRFLSQYRQAREPEPARRPLTCAAIARALASGRKLATEPWVRAIWRTGPPARLYLGGSSCTIAAQYAAKLAGGEVLDAADWAAMDPSDQLALRELLAHGLLGLLKG